MIPLTLRGLAAARQASTFRGVFSSLSAVPKKPVIPSALIQAAPATTAAANDLKHGPFNAGDAYRHHDHSKHWNIERFIDVSMLPLIPYAFITDNVYANYVLVIMLGAHVHWGLEAIVIDYFRPRIVGVAANRLMMAFVYAMSIGTIAGLLYLNYTQMPPTKAIKTLWTL